MTQSNLDLTNIDQYVRRSEGGREGRWGKGIRERERVEGGQVGERSERKREGGR